MGHGREARDGRPALTPAGYAVLGGTILLGVAGWALGYVMLTVMAVAGAAALVLGVVLTLRVPPIEVGRVVEPRRVQRATPAHGLVVVSNPGRRRTRGCVAVERVGDGDVRVEVPRLRPKRMVSVPYPLPTDRRGELVIGPLSVMRQDPFGLWRASRPVGDEVTLTVEPRLIPIPPKPGGQTRHLEGPISDRSDSGTQVFHSLREYTTGDDVRRVHWRSSARTGTLMVREHVDTSLPSTTIVLDLRQDRLPPARFEEAVDVAASVVAAAHSIGFPVRVVTTRGSSLRSRAGQRGRDIAQFLASVQPDEHGGDLARASTEVLRDRDHDVIVVIAGEIDAADLAAVTGMTRRFAAAALVTIRTDGGPRWAGGPHLDGEDAVQALSRWEASAGSAAIGRRFQP